MTKDINNQSKVTTELYILKPGPSEGVNGEAQGGGVLGRILQN